MNKKKLVVAGKITKVRKDLKVDSDFMKRQTLTRSNFLSETEAILPKPPGQARLEMTGV